MKRARCAWHRLAGSAKRCCGPPFLRFVIRNASSIGSSFDPLSDQDSVACAASRDSAPSSRSLAFPSTRPFLVAATNRPSATRALRVHLPWCLADPDSGSRPRGRGPAHARRFSRSASATRCASSRNMATGDEGSFGMPSSCGNRVLGADSPVRLGGGSRCLPCSEDLGRYRNAPLRLWVEVVSSLSSSVSALPGSSLHPFSSRARHVHGGGSCRARRSQRARSHVPSTSSASRRGTDRERDPESVPAPGANGPYCYTAARRVEPLAMVASEREDERLTSFAANHSSVDLRALSE